MFVMIPGMSLFFRAVFAVTLCAGFLRAQAPAAAPAPKPIDPTKAALIAEMITLNHSEQTVNQFLDQYKAAVRKNIEEGFPARLRQQGITDPGKFQPDIVQFEDRIVGVLGERLTWGRMKPAFESLYDETFTVEQLKGIVDFYKSPAGEAMLAKMPVLSARSSQIGQAQIRDLAPEMQKMTQDFVEELKKKGAATK